MSELPVRLSPDRDLCKRWSEHSERLCGHLEASNEPVEKPSYKAVFGTSSTLAPFLSRSKILCCRFL